MTPKQWHAPFRSIHQAGPRSREPGHRSGVPQYWLVNLPESQVEVYEQPDAASGKYAQQTIRRPGHSVAWNLSPTQRLEISVTDLLR